MAGEFSSYTADGYTISFPPDIKPEDFKLIVNHAKDTYFGENNRFLLIMMPVYSKRLDFWSSTYALYEFHTGD